jgi:GNAT superfamily N-acetyltransferase
MRDLYPSIEPLRLKVDTLLRKMWDHLEIDQSFDDWQRHLLEDMGKEDDRYISLFAVRIDEDKVPTEVLGFVVADLSEWKGVYIKYLCSTVEKQGLGTVLLESVLKVVQKTSKHRLAFLNYKPTQELREFYKKRGFLHAAVRWKRNEEYDRTAEVRLTQTELNRLKEYCCSIHSELGVKMLPSV